MKTVAIVMIFFILPGILMAQYSLEEMDTWRVKTSKNNMTILGGWALANIGTGIYGSLYSTGSAKYFHQMNAGWNAVNLGIAALGYFLTKPSKNLNAYEITNQLIGIENSLMLNTGLDVAYITAGIALRLSSNQQNSGNYHRLRGFGTSLVLQGAFLAIFDIYQYSLYKNRRSNFLKNQLGEARVLPLQNGIAIRF